MTSRWLAPIPIAFAALVLAALAFMIATLIGEGAFNPLNFFTFLVMVIWIVAWAGTALRARRTD